MLGDEVLAYYRRGGERARLAEGDGRLEFLRTWDVLSRVLPPAPARVLDVGGATGVYAAPLAAAGYAVHVVDPVDLHVREARAHQGVTAALGDARALPVPGAAVDAVLLLGPLYHLPDRAERVRAWREAARAVRPGGPVVAATISRFASMLDGYIKGTLADPAFGTMVDRALDTGAHRNDSADPRWFTTAYFARPDETPAEAAEAGLAVERVVAVEGPAWLARTRLAADLDDPSRAAALLRALRRVEEEPSLLGASGHLLTVARR
jgi:SAM-dependent methyltransferase